MNSQKSKHSLLNYFSPQMNAAILAALVLVCLNWWIIPSVQRRQKILDYQYEALSEVAMLFTDYNQAMVNVFLGAVMKEEVDAMREYRKQLQAVSAKANGVKVRLWVAFKDPVIAMNWEKIAQIYSLIDYLARQTGQMNAKDLDDALWAAGPLFNDMIYRIRNEIQGNSYRRHICLCDDCDISMQASVQDEGLTVFRASEIYAAKNPDKGKKLLKILDESLASGEIPSLETSRR